MDGLLIRRSQVRILSGVLVNYTLRDSSIFIELSLCKPWHIFCTQQIDCLPACGEQRNEIQTYTHVNFSKRVVELMKTFSFRMISSIIVFLLLTLLVSGQIAEGRFEKGSEVYKRSNYATVLKEFRPLAERGNAAS